MLIQCTKKMLDELKVKPKTGIVEEPLFSWHANLLWVKHRKAVVLVNDRNRYLIVLYGLKARDFKSFDKHVIKSIRETFQEECIRESVIEEFINNSRNIIYGKTRNRSLVARMNQSTKSLHYFLELLDDSSIYQPALSRKLAQYMVGDGDDDYIHPNREMYKDLESFSGKPVFSGKAVVIKVTLALTNYNLWRKLVVPVNISFTDLHRLIQLAFGWMDCHLHEFYIFHKGDRKPFINLIAYEEDLGYQSEYDIEMKKEKGIRLSGYIEERIKYIYDYGDSWEHYIEIEKIIDDYDKNYPVCFDGEGNAPPEDVGGDYGYENFLEIITDKKHPEHDDMLEWGESQGYKEFDLEKVNRLIKNHFA